MKKLLLFVLAAVAFAACEQAPIEEQSAIRQEASETITVGFEGDDDTRIQLNEAQKTVWTKGDLVSVFYRSNANQQWKYDGETGARTAELKRVDAGTSTRDIDRVVVVYPYNKDYYINPETYNVQASLPAVQNYLKDSYGTNVNIMISSSEYNQFSLKSVCGWLKLQLTGDGETIKSIKFRGNDGEQVAGELYINSADATAALASDMGNADDNNAGGNLVFEDTILREVVLDCGEGVALGKEATAFYIALPPQTFEKGLTIDIVAADGAKMTKSTSNAIIIERNTIQPMSAFCYEGVYPEIFELAYTTNNGHPLSPYTTEGFGSNFVENIYDAATGKGSLIFDGKITTIPENAFVSCTNLTWIDLPFTVTKISNGAFNGCSNIKELTLPASITSLGVAFENCGGKLYVNCRLNYGANYSSSGRFYKSLFTDVIIADGIDRIGEFVFADCEKLTNITIPNSVTTIGKGTFDRCISLTTLSLPDNLTYIAEYLFYECSNLTSIVIPNKVASIGISAFAYCTSLSSIVLPPSLKTIANSAFSDCESVQNVYISDLSAWCKISFDTYGSNPLYGSKYKTGYAKLYLQGEEVTNLVIPDDILKVNYGAFEGCGSITNVTISGRVTSIGQNAFARCGNIESVTIGDSVATIGANAFNNCDKLNTLTIGSGVVSIGDEAFCFEKSSSLKTVYCKSTAPPSTATHLFHYHPYYGYSYASYCSIYVPYESVSYYKETEHWSVYADKMIAYDFENGVVVE